jgi:hypothetical protein
VQSSAQPDQAAVHACVGVASVAAVAAAPPPLDPVHFEIGKRLQYWVPSRKRVDKQGSWWGVQVMNRRKYRGKQQALLYFLNGKEPHVEPYADHGPDWVPIDSPLVARLTKDLADEKREAKRVEKAEKDAAKAREPAAKEKERAERALSAAPTAEQRHAKRVLDDEEKENAVAGKRMSAEERLQATQGSLQPVRSKRQRSDTVEGGGGSSGGGRGRSEATARDEAKARQFQQQPSPPLHSAPSGGMGGRGDGGGERSDKSCDGGAGTVPVMDRPPWMGIKNDSQKGIKNGKKKVSNVSLFVASMRSLLLSKLVVSVMCHACVWMYRISLYQYRHDVSHI